MRKKKRYFSRATCFILCAVFALLFLLPTVLTITNSFMTQSEITASYGQVFENANDGKSYISKTINLKFIPDKVSFTQYFTVLLKSPDYLLKFWNSVILTAPIVFAQLMVASIAAYGFTRWRGKVRDSLFFFYVILMLMPYQVTLVPNYLEHTIQTFAKNQEQLRQQINKSIEGMFPVPNLEEINKQNMET